MILVNDQREHPSSSPPVYVLVNDQREHPSSSPPVYVSQSVSQYPSFSTCVTDITYVTDVNLSRDLQLSSTCVTDHPNHRTAERGFGDGPREMKSRDLATSRGHERSRGLPSGDAISWPCNLTRSREIAWTCVTDIGRVFSEKCLLFEKCPHSVGSRSAPARLHRRLARKLAHSPRPRVQSLRRHHSDGLREWTAPMTGTGWSGC